MGPERHEIAPECEVLFKKNEEDHAAFTEHVKDSGPVRDMIARHDEQLKPFEGGVSVRDKVNNHDAILKTVQNIPTMFLASTGINIVVIVVAALMVGRYLQKVDALERLHDGAGKHVQVETKGVAYAGE